jgi:seryl-tRNA synthetase
MTIWMLIPCVLLVLTCAALTAAFRDARAQMARLAKESAANAERAASFLGSTEVAERAFQEAAANNTALARRVKEVEAERDALVASIETSEASVIVVPTEEVPPLTDEQKAALIANRCVHCGGSHTIACPRVKRLRFRADGQTPVEVEFWPLDVWRDAWAEERIVWPEDVAG